MADPSALAWRFAHQSREPPQWERVGFWGAVSGPRVSEKRYQRADPDARCRKIAERFQERDLL